MNVCEIVRGYNGLRLAKHVKGCAIAEYYKKSSTDVYPPTA